MTLRLALVIEGDGSGAKRALEETAAGVEDLGRKSEEAGRKLETVSRGIQWNENEADRAHAGLKATADEAGRAAASMSAVGDASTRATPEIVQAGEAAGVAGGKFSDMRSVLLGIAGGVGAVIAIAAIGEGLRIAAGYAGELFREITSNQPMIERALENHADLVGRIKGAWAEAEGAASSYGLFSAAQLRFESQQNVRRLEESFGAALGDLEGRGALAPIMQDTAGGRDRLGPLRQEINDFRRDLREGEADVIAFRRRVAEIAEALPEESPFRGLAEIIFEDTQAAAELQAELERARDLLDGLKGDADAAATALGGTADKYRELTDDAGAAGEAIGTSADRIRRSGEEAEAAIPALTEYDRLLRSIAAGGDPDLGNPARGALTPLLQGRGFAGGGFTGNMPADRIAGFVHGQEYVFDAPSTARIGVSNLEAIRQGAVPGFAGGGYVGAMPVAGSPVAGGASPTIALADEFRLLQGSAHQLGMTLWRTGDFGHALGSVFQSLSQRALDFSLRALDQLLLGGGAGGGFGLVGSLLGLGGGTNYFPPAPVLIGGGLYHGGGRVGPSPAASRLVPAATFIDAPRLHGGGWLKPGERPVIAMDGEEIGWPDDLARKYGGGDTTINHFHIETPSPRAFAESRATVARAAGRLAARAGRHS